MSAPRDRSALCAGAAASEERRPRDAVPGKFLLVCEELRGGGGGAEGEGGKGGAGRMGKREKGPSQTKGEEGKVRKGRRREVKGVEED